jgi:hypothetical protein
MLSDVKHSEALLESVAANVHVRRGPERRRKALYLREFDYGQTRERIKSMANFSDADKRPTDGDNRKKAGSPDPKRKSGTMLDKDELPEPEAGKIVGGVMGDPCAGGQYRGR